MSNILLTEEEIRKIISEMILKETLAASNIFSRSVWAVADTNIRRRRSASDKQKARQVGVAMDCYFCKDNNASAYRSQYCEMPPGNEGWWTVVDPGFKSRVEEFLNFHAIADMETAQGFEIKMSSPPWRSERKQLDLYDSGDTTEDFSYHMNIRKTGLNNWHRAALAVDLLPDGHSTRTASEMTAMYNVLSETDVRNEAARLDISIYTYGDDISKHVHLQDTSESIQQVEARYRRGEERILTWAQSGNNCTRDEIYED